MRWLSDWESKITLGKFHTYPSFKLILTVRGNSTVFNPNLIWFSEFLYIYILHRGTATCISLHNENICSLTFVETFQAPSSPFISNYRSLAEMKAEIIKIAVYISAGENYIMSRLFVWD